MKLLIIEDDVKTSDALARGLREEGFVVDVANDGEYGLECALHGGCDLVLLDVSLPCIDGWQVLRDMRAEGCTTPVILLTARDAVEDKVLGLSLGADDYVVKPCPFAEIVARARAVLRRRGPLHSDTLTFEDLSHDPLRGVTRRGDQVIQLTSRESQLLELLMRHEQQVLSRSYISERVWDMAFDGDVGAVDTSIWRLRAKVDGPFDRKLIHTVRGRGYAIR
ncbi:MAG: response regulator [Hyphomonadaceae bacterium]